MSLLKRIKKKAEEIHHSLESGSTHSHSHAASSSSSPYANPYPPNNPSSNTSGYSPYSLPPNNQQPPPFNQGATNYQNPPTSNPYLQQQDGRLPNQQQQPFQSPYSSAPAPPSYNPQQASQVIERLQAVAARYEINNALTQRLRILEQFELVVVCDDSSSMNAPVQGTRGTRWDELKTVVQIIIEIGVVLDSNGVDIHFLNRAPMLNVTDVRRIDQAFAQPPKGMTPLVPALRQIFQSAASRPGSDKRLLVFVATDGAPTDNKGHVDIGSLERLMHNERKANTTHVAFLACTDDESSVSYLSQWDRTMVNVDVTDDYKTEREEVRRTRGPDFPFSYGDYIAKALLGAVDPQMDALDEFSYNNNVNRQ